MSNDDPANTGEEFVPRQLLDDVLARLSVLEAEIRTLRGEGAAGEGAASDTRPAPAPAPAPDHRWTRRALLLGGVGAAAGAVAGIGGAEPAAADAGGPLLLGQANDAGTGLTSLTSSANSADAVFEIAAAGNCPGLECSAKSYAAVRGRSTQWHGVVGTSEGNAGSGVWGSCAGGFGVWGQSSTGEGIHGQSDWGIGVYGFGATGVSGYGSPGVRGESFAGFALEGKSTDGDAVHGVTASGTGVYAESGTGPALVLVNTGLAAPPSDAKSGVWRRGSVIMTTKGELWICVATGSPGTWRLLMAPTMSGAYVPITPVRVYDSRFIPPGAGRAPAPIPVGGNRIISVAQGYKVNSDTPIPFTGVPAGVRAIAINLTATNVKAKGWLSLQPGNIATIGTSCINWAAGQPIANGLMVTLDDNRQLNAFAKGSDVDVIIDVAGYFRAT